MAFDVSTITLKGAELLAAATSSDRFIVVGCDADTTVLTQQQAIYHSNRPASPVSNTTEVTPINHYTMNSIYIRAYFRAGETTGGSVNTLYLYGHLESDSAHDYVIFIASASTSFHLPEVGDVMDEWEARLSINYNPNTDSIAYATSATYATQASVDALEDRMVSVHAFNSLTQGDNQNIYGIKTFKNGIESRYISLADDDYVCFGSDDNTRFWGDDARFIIDHDSGEGYKEALQISSSGSGNIGTTLSSHGYDLEFKVCKPYNTSYKNFQIALVRTDTSSVHTLTVEPSVEGSTYSGYSLNLGSTSKPFNNVYANNLNGVIPYPSESDSLPPVGSIFLGIIEGVSGSGATHLKAGFVLDYSTNEAYSDREYDLRYATAMPKTNTYTPNFSIGATISVVGTKYVLLCGIFFNSGQHDSQFLVLVQRIL